jgi:uncharacterized protein YuzE
MAMKIEYDDEVDAAFVYFNKEMEEARSEPANVQLENAAIILLWGVDGKLRGLELLGASRILPKNLLMANRVQRT